MKKLRVLFVSFIFIASVFTAFAGGAMENSVTPPTKEEENAGWRYFKPIGFKLHRPSFFDTNKDNIEAATIGKEDETPEEVVYAAYTYGFFSDELDEEYNVIRNNSELTSDEKWEKIEKEIAPKIKKIYALYVLRTPLIKGKIEDITNYANNKIMRKTNKFTHIFAYENFSSEHLSEKSSDIYKNMLSQIQSLPKTITCTDPISANSVMMNIKDLRFTTTDLNGQTVTSSIFEPYDVTMINIWATWCPPCREELPEIAKLYEAFKSKNCNVLGIAGDVTSNSQEPFKKAKSLLEKAGCKYTVVQNCDGFSPLFNSMKAWPTTIFVDKTGSVIATSPSDIIVGSRTLEEFTAAMEKALKTVQSK